MSFLQKVSRYLALARGGRQVYLQAVRVDTGAAAAAEERGPGMKLASTLVSRFSGELKLISSMAEQRFGAQWQTMAVKLLKDVDSAADGPMRFKNDTDLELVEAFVLFSIAKFETVRYMHIEKRNELSLLEPTTVAALGYEIWAKARKEKRELFLAPSAEVDLAVTNTVARAADLQAQIAETVKTIFTIEPRMKQSRALIAALKQIKMPNPMHALLHERPEGAPLFHADGRALGPSDWAAIRKARAKAEAQGRE